MITGRASSSIIFLIPQALCFRLKNQSYPGLMNGRFISRYLFDSMHERYTISSIWTRESLWERKQKSKNYFTFERYFQDISSITNKDSYPFQKMCWFIEFPEVSRSKGKIILPDPLISQIWPFILAFTRGF